MRFDVGLRDRAAVRPPLGLGVEVQQDRQLARKLLLMMHGRAQTEGVLHQLSGVKPYERALPSRRPSRTRSVSGHRSAPHWPPIGIRQRDRRFRRKGSYRLNSTPISAPGVSIRASRRGCRPLFHGNRTVASRRTDDAGQPHASHPGGGCSSAGRAMNGPNTSPPGRRMIVARELAARDLVAGRAGIACPDQVDRQAGQEGSREHVGISVMAVELHGTRPVDWKRSAWPTLTLAS